MLPLQFEKMCRKVQKFLDSSNVGRDLTYFKYDRCYNDFSRLILNNRSDWSQHFINSEYYKISYFSSKISTLSSKKVYWNSMNENSSVLMNDAQENFNITSGMTLISKHESYTEYYHFGFGRDSAYSIDQLTNKEIYDLINGFRYRCRRLILFADAHRIIYPIGNIYDKDIYLLEENAKEFSEKIRRYYFDSHNMVYLTRAELECLKSLSTYGSINDMAIELNISERTAYTHIENIKNKLNCRTLFQLGQLVAKYHLLSFL